MLCSVQVLTHKSLPWMVMATCLVMMRIVKWHMAAQRVVITKTCSSIIRHLQRVIDLDCQKESERVTVTL